MAICLDSRRSWSDGRVAEGARLESVYTGNRIVGSNPTPSAKSPFHRVSLSCKSPYISHLISILAFLLVSLRSMLYVRRTWVQTRLDHCHEAFTAFRQQK